MGPQLFQQINMGSLDLSASSAVRFYPLIPIVVHTVGFVIVTAPATTAPVVSFSILETDGTAVSPSGVAACGTCTATSATMAVNTGVYNRTEQTKGRRVVYPGEQLAAVVTTTASAGVAQVTVVVSNLGFANVNQRASVASHPGSTTLSTALQAMTLVTA